MSLGEPVLIILALGSATAVIGVRCTFVRALRKNNRRYWELGSGHVFDPFTTDRGGWLFAVPAAVALVESLSYSSLSLPATVRGGATLGFLGFCALLLWTDGLLAIHFNSYDVHNPRLIESGPYAVVRHPRYASWLGLLVTFCVSLNSPADLTLTVLFSIMVVRRVLLEEVFLLTLYGARYRRYSAKTYRLVPLLW
jgi:protein-S-isoprenylcysteine O-methyltransferase Ste14